MRILLSEDKFINLMSNNLLEYNGYDGNSERNPYEKKIENGVSSLEKLLAREGTPMINIRNGREYLTYEIYSLANAIGKRYCLCQLIKDGEPYGSIFTKPMDLFKMKNY